ALPIPEIAQPADHWSVQQPQPLLEFHGDDFGERREDKHVGQIGERLLAVGLSLSHVLVVRILRPLVTRQAPFTRHVDVNLPHRTRLTNRTRWKRPASGSTAGAFKIWWRAA